MEYIKGPSDLDTLFYYKWHSEKIGNNLYGNKMPIHIHQSAELMLITKGEMKLSVAGNGYETIREGMAAFVLPFRPHTYVAEPHAEYLRCNFSSTLIPEFFNTLGNKEGEKSAFTTDPTTVYHFQKRILEDKKMSLWSIRAFLYSALDDYLSDVPLRESGSDSHILTRAISYISNHKSEDLTIGKVASAIGYSKSHLSFCINNAGSFNFNTLLSMLRIEDARIMLKNTKKSILEISLECGFGSERSFYRQFKAITGKSPKDYREGTIFKTIEEPIKSKI